MEKPVLVTTFHRGVFFGDLEEENGKEYLILKNARNCIYWSSDCGGFLGLAEKGPTKSCKIGTKVSQIKLYDITSVSLVTEKAVKAWMEAR